jgi:hypothetical protein
VLQRAAANIKGFIGSLWGTEGDLELLVLTGGGAQLLSTALDGDGTVSVYIPHDPVLANARGFCKYAKRIYGNKAEEGDGAQAGRHRRVLLNRLSD